MKRNMINVTPMIPGFEKETAADLIRMFRKGVIQSAMFICSLVPEGDPVSDKADRLAELYRKQKVALGKCGMPVGILIQSMIGHGWVPAEKAPFQKFTYADGQTPYVFCPLDPGFQAYVRASIRTVAQLKPDFFMMDDDTRMHSGRGGCFCPLHMKEFNRRIRKKYSPAQLKEALLKDDALAEVWDKFQQEGLFEMVRRIRAEFDAVDPSIQGMFCTCNGDIRHAPAMAEILAAKGAPPVLRINNPEYLYMHEKPNEVIAWMQKTAVQKAHAPEECTILVETDTCCHNRCFTSATTIHALYTWSLLNGCSGGKLWITDTAEYSPATGKAYRKKLAEYSGFYDAVYEMEPEWQGVVSPLIPYPKFNVAAHPWGMTGYTSWNTDCFGFLGLPHAYVKDPGPDTVIALCESEVGFATDEQLKTYLKRNVLLDGGAALALTKRGFGDRIGVRAEEWDLPEATFEKTVDGMTMQKVCPGVKLTPVSRKSAVRSCLFHSPFRHAKESEPLAPGAVRFENRFGGTVLTVSGKLPGEYWFASAGLLNPYRKEFLRKELGLRIWYAGDAPLALHTFMDRGHQTICAFNLGLDPLNRLELSGLPEGAGLEKLSPRGTWKPAVFEKGVVKVKIEPMELVFLRTVSC